MNNQWYFDIVEIFKVTTILFAVIDIIGSIPVIISIRQRVGEINPYKASMVSMDILHNLYRIEKLLDISGIGYQIIQKIHRSMKGLYTIILLLFSNTFMTLAWYGHLRFKDLPFFSQKYRIIRHHLHQLGDCFV